MGEVQQGEAAADGGARPKNKRWCSWRRVGSWIGRGIRSDLRKRVPLWPRDWLDGLHFRVLASIVFMFFSSAAPAVTFGQTMQDDTEHQIGVVETLFSTALCGVLFAVVGGQPLVVLGVTGPVVIFTRTIYSIAKDLDLDFLQFYSWIGIWSALMHCALALANTCRLLKLVTLLSCETFGVLIAIIYIKDAVTGFVDYLNDYPADAAFASGRDGPLRCWRGAVGRTGRSGLRRRPRRARTRHAKDSEEEDSR